jgi:uncharacterized membrane protein YhiD involved in acid resistance
MRIKLERIFALIVIFAAIALPAASAFGQKGVPKDDPPGSNTSAQSPPGNSSDNPFASSAQGPPANASLIDKAEFEAITFLQMFWRLTVALILSAALAFRPRKNVPLLRRSLFVSQTQILLAVVAAALMMVVGDNTARAFAIFAAASLVRFRTNIKDPKEITVLLISLALGLAAGVGRWELGIALCLFALALLWLLEFNESTKIFRAMEVTVRTRNTDQTQELLRTVFQKYKVDAEVREICPPEEEGSVGSLVYFVTLHLGLSTDRLSDLIMKRDPENVEGILWSQKKGANEAYL